MSLENDAYSAWARIQQIDSKTDELLRAVVGLFRAVELLTNMVESLHDKIDVLEERAKSHDG